MKDKTEAEIEEYIAEHKLEKVGVEDIRNADSGKFDASAFVGFDETPSVEKPKVEKKVEEVEKPKVEKKVEEVVTEEVKTEEVATKEVKTEDVEAKEEISSEEETDSEESK